MRLKCAQICPGEKCWMQWFRRRLLAMEGALKAAKRSERNIVKEEAAEEMCRIYEDYHCHKGKSKLFGERSIGHQDPGATLH